MGFDFLCAMAEMHTNRFAESPTSCGAALSLGIPSSFSIIFVFFVGEKLIAFTYLVGTFQRRIVPTGLRKLLPPFVLASVFPSGANANLLI